MTQATFTVPASGTYVSAANGGRYQYFEGDVIPLELAVDLGMEGASLPAAGPPFNDAQVAYLASTYEEGAQPVSVSGTIDAADESVELDVGTNGTLVARLAYTGLIGTIFLVGTIDDDYWEAITFEDMTNTTFRVLYTRNGGSGDSVIRANIIGFTKVRIEVPGISAGSLAVTMNAVPGVMPMLETTYWSTLLAIKDNTAQTATNTTPAP